MNALTKLTVAALSAAGIAGGVAVAQTTPAAPNTIDGRADTANYGTPPGAPLKRDGSLSADPKAATTDAPMATSTTSTTTTATTDTTVATPAADTSSTMAEPADTSAAPVVDATPAPRADRN